MGKYRNNDDWNIRKYLRSENTKTLMIGKSGKVLKGKPEEQGDGRNSDRELPRRKAEESRSPFKSIF